MEAIQALQLQTDAKHRRITSQVIERFLFECRKTKTKVITLTNHNTRENNHMNQSELEANTCRPCQVRENAVHASRDWFWFYF